MHQGNSAWLVNVSNVPCLQTLVKVLFFNSNSILFTILNRMQFTSYFVTMCTTEHLLINNKQLLRNWF